MSRSLYYCNEPRTSVISAAARSFNGPTMRVSSAPPPFCTDLSICSRRRAASSPKTSLCRATAPISRGVDSLPAPTCPERACSVASGEECAHNPCQSKTPDVELGFRQLDFRCTAAPHQGMPSQAPVHRQTTNQRSSPYSRKWMPQSGAETARPN
jgi:hypothetical protein